MVKLVNKQNNNVVKEVDNELATLMIETGDWEVYKEKEKKSRLGEEK